MRKLYEDLANYALESQVEIESIKLHENYFEANRCSIVSQCKEEAKERNKEISKIEKKHDLIEKDCKTVISRLNSAIDTHKEIVTKKH